MNRSTEYHKYWQQRTGELSLCSPAQPHVLCQTVQHKSLLAGEYCHGWAVVQYTPCAQQHSFARLTPVVRTQWGCTCSWLSVDWGNIRMVKLYWWQGEQTSYMILTKNPSSLGLREAWLGWPSLTYLAVQLQEDPRVEPEIAGGIVYHIRLGNNLLIPKLKSIPSYFTQEEHS